MKALVRSLVVASALLGISTIPSGANTIANCGLDPVGCLFNSGGANSAAGSFTMDVTFNLDTTLTITTSSGESAESKQADRYITGWQLGIYNSSNVLVAGLVTATDNTGPPPDNIAQNVTILTVLGPGSYYAEFTGTGGATASFTGSLDTFSPTGGNQGVPGPIAGAGLPGLIMGAGGFLAFWRRRRQAA
jgi:hypothetical protein